MEARTTGERKARADLKPHPDSPVSCVDWISVAVARSALATVLRYEVTGYLDCLRVPSLSDGARADNLWRFTCFELFVRSETGSYREYNISPSGQWAAYDFEGYREGMSLAEVPAPNVSVSRSEGRLVVEAALGILVGPLAISAVMEDTEGSLSYWALAHPPGKPDFHHPDSFVLTLPPLEPA